jgi:hypothetical protein
LEKFAAAFVAFGGLTAVGGFIDLLMRSSEKKRLKGWLTDWWIRFDDVKWRNFGQQEATQALVLLDRWAGARLWSRARWRAVVAVSLASLAAACALFVLLTTLRWFQDGAHLSLVAYHAGTWRDSYLPTWIIVPLFLACPLCFALALSVMRFLAACVRDWIPPGAAGFLSFAALLLLQIAIAIYWTAGILLVGLGVDGLIVMDGGRLREAVGPRPFHRFRRHAVARQVAGHAARRLPRIGQHQPDRTGRDIPDLQGAARRDRQRPAHRLRAAVPRLVPVRSRSSSRWSVACGRASSSQTSRSSR